MRSEYMEPAWILRCHLQQNMMTVDQNDNEKGDGGGEKVSRSIVEMQVEHITLRGAALSALFKSSH